MFVLLSHIYFASQCICPAVPVKTSYEDAPRADKRSSLPKPSIMNRKFSEAGDGSSKTNPRKAVNFAPGNVANHSFEVAFHD
jgi:hypothetical protein